MAIIWESGVDMQFPNRTNVQIFDDQDPLLFQQHGEDIAVAGQLEQHISVQDALSLAILLLQAVSAYIALGKA
jgi:hypothetical protein